MYSPMMASSSCSMMAYNLLDNPSNLKPINGIGSVFQTLEYSTPKITENFNPSITSGYAVVSRLGQIIYRNSNNPEEVMGSFFCLDIYQRLFNLQYPHPFKFKKRIQSSSPRSLLIKIRWNKEL